MMKPSPSMAVALTALIFSMAGTGIAASHYLISSTSQIAPSVMAKLHGARGPQGPAGPEGRQVLEYRITGGPTGVAGVNGTNGTNGANGAEGPRGFRGCGEAPEQLWKEHEAYVQGCSNQSGGTEWRYVVDPIDHKQYGCTNGRLDFGFTGKYCEGTVPPSEDLEQWTLKP